MSNVFRTLDLLKIDAKKNNLHIKCIAGRNGLDRIIESRNINRPGLALGGFFDIFSFNCIQIFGRGEVNFIRKYKDSNIFKNVETFLDYQIPCCIFSNNEMPPQNFLDIANSKSVPILISELATSDLVATLFDILSEFFSLKTTIHGVLVDIYGLGVLILGKSGIGKSETALELIQRGHRLIADDSIIVKSIRNKLIGYSSNIVGHHLEIRGIGIIDAKKLFGIGAVKPKKRIQLVIELERWKKKEKNGKKEPKEYERLGMHEKYYELLGVKIPYLLIPVSAGRNIPIIIETASMNQRLKNLGINSAKEFNKKLMDFYEIKELKKTYFIDNDT